ncbi:MAG: rhodanese-like domain-containing protein [Burkholderiales bacterium]
MTQLTPDQLKTWLADSIRTQPVLLDVREPWEFQICQIPGSLHIPMNTVPHHKDRLDPDADTVLICHHGSRSFQVGIFLERAGFSRIFNLDGGVNAWARQVEPAMPVY